MLKKHRQKKKKLDSNTRCLHTHNYQGIENENVSNLVKI
jgi:hypothetical protein